jgi:plastocyanin
MPITTRGRNDRCSLPATGTTLVVVTVALLLLAACGGNQPTEAATTAAQPSAAVTTEATPPRSPAAASASASPSEVREVEVTVANGVVDTATERVEVATGETVRLVVTSDIDDELHVHGAASTQAELRAGQPTTLEVSFDEPGVYYVELHESGILLLQLEVH